MKNKKLRTFDIFPLGLRIPLYILSSFTECGSLQAYPLKTVHASQLKLSALACYNIWREMERKKWGILPVRIQSKCSMSDQGIYYDP